MTKAHFVDVGQGNMTIIETAGGHVVLYDCHITDQNQAKVLGYLHRTLQGRHISAFANSHRDTDHMRGVQRIRRYVAPIDSVWDCGVTGSNPACDDYRDYMQLRRDVPCYQLATGMVFPYSGTTFRVLAGRDSRSTDPNSQSLILKIEDGPCSVMLTGDSDVRAWRWITTAYPSYVLKSDALAASHHGSMTFFEETDNRSALLDSYLPPPETRRPSLGALVHPQTTRRRASPLSAILAESAATRIAAGPQRRPLENRASILALLALTAPKKRFTRHMELIAPQAVIVSVGENGHGHPKVESLRLYAEHTSDPPIATLPRVCRTDQLGSLKMELGTNGWALRRTW